MPFFHTVNRNLPFYFKNTPELTDQILVFPIHCINRASMSFSATFSPPINVCAQIRTGFCYSAASWSSMAPTLIPSVKTSLGASKSAFLCHNLPLQSSISRRVFSKAQFSGVSARAATEKSIHDFTVKVLFCILLFFVFLPVILQYCSSGAVKFI